MSGSTRHSRRCLDARLAAARRTTRPTKQRGEAKSNQPQWGQMDLSFSLGSGGRGDERLHAGDPNQIGRVRVVGEGPAGLDLPGSQCGSEAR
jgi:hypothetical protein